MVTKTAPRVFVGLSGGVDSSVAALRLKNRGYEVVGVFIKVWHPDFLVCNWEQERLDAMRVAAHLDIPFLTCDAVEAYRKGVAEYFIGEYLAGRTPNPDVMCNKHVKFGAFIDFAKSYGADYVATGHYARRVDGVDGPELHRGIDPNKDQSYFLWSLTKEQLAYTLLPIGDTIKDLIRQEAKIANIPTALKKDSQGICFLGHIDIREFLSHYTELKTGDVLDQSGNIIGTHHGALIYTKGQRHGLSIDTKESTRQIYYVLDKDVAKNTVTVSAHKPILKEQDDINLEDVLLRTKIEKGEVIDMQTRYHQIPIKAQIVSRGDSVLTLSLQSDGEAAALGQSCVLYKDTLCLGGGIIS